MAMIKTEFIGGVSLSYPISIYPKLFAVLETRTKRKFFEKINELDGKDGEGMTPEQIIGIFHVGLMSSIPDITFKKTEEYVSDYIFEYGDEALIFKLVDAFVDSGLNDRKAVQKNRERAEKNKALREELDQIRDERNKAILQKCWKDVEKLNAKTQLLRGDLDKIEEEAEKEEAKAIEALKKEGSATDDPLDPDTIKTE